MALQLTHIKPDNSSGHYWKIRLFQFDLLNGNLSIVLSLYKDLQSRKDAHPMMSIDYLFTQEQHGLCPEDRTEFRAILAKLYKLIKEDKTTFDFSRSLDV